MERITQEKTSHRLWLGVVMIGVIVVAAANAWAEQSGARRGVGVGVADSGMEQGSGSITHRADVNLAIESLPGTSAVRVGAIGEAVGTQMTAIRQCYADVTETRPVVQGSLRIRLQLAAKNRGQASLQVAEDTVGDQPLRNCILRAIRQASFANIRGPSGGLIVIQFQNTAAEGAELVAREAEQATEAVRMVDGRPQAQATTPGGEVTVTVAGAGRTNTDAVAAYFRGVQARIGMLLDCRRHASRQGMDPEGDVVLTVRIPHRGMGDGRSRSSTVDDQNAPTCILRCLTRAGRGQSGASGIYQVTVHFTGR